MLSKWSIRVKMLIGLGLLLLAVVILSSSGLCATYAYRRLVKTLSSRVTELPVAAKLSRHVGGLRIRLSEIRGLRTRAFPNTNPEQVLLRIGMVRDQFGDQLDAVQDTLAEYQAHLEYQLKTGSQITDNRRERETVEKIEAALARVHEANQGNDWILDSARIDHLEAELENLEALAAELPSHLHRRLAGFAARVRSSYRTLIVGTWITSVVAGLMLALFIKLFYQWVFRPLRVLIAGSRMVAAGLFSYRIHLKTDDEMAELAEAMNGMTARFQAIRDDLDRQVRERTRQVVRSEQMASVGFLAAGVAHEINNPLASIALCAESLEGRSRETLDTTDSTPTGPEADAPQDVVQHYLRMIQSEAFRCKEITEKLLDFSRTGEVKRQHTELGGLVQGVIEMMSHLGRYRRKQVVFHAGGPVVTPVNAQEIKQVVLNLLANALDSIDHKGTVRVKLCGRDGYAELTFDDDGCGMEPDVLRHVFEPFFTRRRVGQGTGLGLSITYQIVAEHGGDIEAQSPGPGRGATFRVRLPLSENQEENQDQHQAA